MSHQVDVDSMSADGQFIYFWYRELAGDATVENGIVHDVQLTETGVSLDNGVAKGIQEYLQDWYNHEREQP